MKKLINKIVTEETESYDRLKVMTESLSPHLPLTSRSDAEKPVGVETT